MNSISIFLMKNIFLQETFINTTKAMTILIVIIL